MQAVESVGRKRVACELRESFLIGRSHKETVMKSISRVLLPCTLFAAAAVFAAGEAPDALVRSTVEDVLGVIKQARDKNDLRRIAEQKVVEHFDFAAMTRLAVGKAWRKATPEQQQALESNFRSLLVSTYTTALSLASGADRSVEVKPLRSPWDQSDVTVKTLVRQPGQGPITIDYRMENTAGGWKVYDVLVDDLSLVTTYRGTFTETIDKSGIDGLVKALEEKNRSLAKS